ncbi:hypothetical protein [Nocardiopsis oceani]
MTISPADDANALIPQPPQRLPELRQALATVAPSRPSDFFDEIQGAFTQAGEENSVVPTGTGNTTPTLSSMTCRKGLFAR